MLQNLSLWDIRENLYEIQNNGDPWGYDSDEEGYYQEYKPFFDELAVGADGLLYALDEYDVEDFWDDITVALLGSTSNVLGYDVAETDYYPLSEEYMEELAQQEARKRLERHTKSELITMFRKCLLVLMSYADMKAAHDCLTSIVEELDDRAAIFRRKDDEINRVYEDLTGSNAAAFDEMVKRLPNRMWVM